MDELNPLLAVWTSPTTTEPAATEAKTEEPAPTAIARGSGHIEKPVEVRERTEHSVMEGLPGWKQERVAAMRKELAELQRQLLESQQRVATELQGRAEDAERYEALEARLQAQETAAKESATRRTELETELETLRTSTEELRRELTTRDAQIDESRKQHRSLSQQFEAQTALVNESKSSRETFETELFKLKEARDEAEATATRLAQEHTDKLEALRKEHREATEKLDAEITFLRDAQKASSLRDAELTATTSERDSLKSDLETTRYDLETARKDLETARGDLETTRRDLETARKDLDGSRSKTREIATQLVRLGTALADGEVTNTAVPSLLRGEPASAPIQVRRPQPPPVPAPPPLPPPRAAEPEKIEAIFDIADIEEQRPASPLRSVLMLVAGVIVGCGATYALTKGGPRTSASSYREDLGVAPSVSLNAPSDGESASAPLVAPLAKEGDTASQAVPPSVPTPPLAFVTTSNRSTADSTTAEGRIGGRCPDDRGLTDRCTDDRSAGEVATAPTTTAARTDTTTTAETSAAPASNASSTEGVILLPDSASGHRVFFDGKVIDVKRSRSTVPCGAHKIKIGSSGVERDIEVACGGETSVGQAPGDR